MSLKKLIPMYVGMSILAACSSSSSSGGDTVESDYFVNVRSFSNVDSVVLYASYDDEQVRTSYPGSAQTSQGYIKGSIEAPQGSRVEVRAEIWSGSEIIASQNESFQSGSTPLCPEPIPVAKIQLADTLVCYLDLPQCALMGTAKTRTNASTAKLKELGFDFDGDGNVDTSVTASGYGVDSMALLTLKPKALFGGEVSKFYFQVTDYSERTLIDSVYVVAKAHADTIVDSRDKQKYATRKIGNQVWMVENLNYKTTSGSWCYANKSANCDKYGRLYDWNTVMAGGTKESVQGVCPKGWHVPSNREWEDLNMFADTTDNREYDFTGGNSLKSVDGWEKYDTGTDLFGFDALPAGMYVSEEFLYQGSMAYFWTSTQGTYPWAVYRGIAAWSGFSQATHDKSDAYSVRCVEDSQE